MQLDNLKNWIDEQQPLFVSALERLVNLNTFTDNMRGVDHGMDMLCEMAEAMGFQIGVIHGRHRLIKAGNGRGARVLLVAHMDTVHPPEGDFQHYEPMAEGFVRGPGVADIKGGLLMGLWAMQAIDLLCEDFDLQLVISADEERGSPTLRDWYLEGKGGADYAIGLEPGFPQGPLTMDVPMGVVYQRKGSWRLRFKLRGKAAHAGGAWDKGLSAIEAMAHRILKLHALSDFQRGITLNVGLVEGGTAVNTIAEYAEAQVDCRFLAQADGEDVLQQAKTAINALAVHNPYLDITESVAEQDVLAFMAPMEHTPRNQVLVDLVLEEAARLGQNVVPIVRGGGSDANYLSQAGIPCICGMGAPAEGIHTSGERVLLPLLFNRLELLIASVYRLLTQKVG